MMSRTLAGSICKYRKRFWLFIKWSIKFLFYAIFFLNHTSFLGFYEHIPLYYLSYFIRNSLLSSFIWYFSYKYYIIFILNIINVLRIKFIFREKIWRFWKFVLLNKESHYNHLLLCCYYMQEVKLDIFPRNNIL